MKIEVAIKKDEPQDKRGRLLEKIAKELLLIQNYDVVERIRITGTEVDLMCKYKVNNKKIIVECKAYNENNNVQATDIKKLLSMKLLKKDCSEFWLITTGPLGRDAKGLIEQLESGDESEIYAFFTPDKLMSALVDSSKIKSESIINYLITENNFENYEISQESIFLITEYGYFWIKKILKGGDDSRVIIFRAEDGSIVNEKELINNLKELDTTFKELDFEPLSPEICLENLKLNSSYLEKINDIGIRINHPLKEIVTLEDIFIYPDLKEITEEDEKIFVSSDELFKRQDKYNKVFIFGEDVSGKTSLAYFLQKEFNFNNFIAIFIDAEDIKISNKEFFSKLLVKKFKKQYSDNNKSVDLFKKILKEDIDKIILLIDNYELINIKNKQKQIDFLSLIKGSFKNIIFFSGNSLKMEFFSSKDMKNILDDTTFFEISELGHVLRDKLLEKWIKLGGIDNIPEEDFLTQRDALSDKIKTVVGLDFIPTYPIYIISILQFMDERMSPPKGGSSYANLYSYLITGAFQAVHIDHDDLDFFYTYLSYLAYYFFQNKRKNILEKELISLYSKYCEEMDIDKNFITVHDLLVSSKIINKIDSLYVFNHNYTYYFFVAKYLSDNIHEPKIKEDIKNITTNLYKNDYANIILFLIHHSKDVHVINNVLNEAKKVFEGILPNMLSIEEIKKVNELTGEELKISIEENSPKEYRRKTLEEKDILEREKKREKNNWNEEKEKDLFFEMNLGIKLVEIQGQVLKNHYGSLNGELKGKILDSTCYLGLRSLSAMLDSFEEFQDLLNEKIKEKKERKKGKNISSEEKEKIINTIIFSFDVFIASFFIDKISESISSKNLLQTIRKIEDRNSNPALKLIVSCVELNFYNGLEKEKIIGTYKSFQNNYLAQALLKLMVIKYFYKFDVKYSIKQSVCDNLNINIKGGGGFLNNRTKKIKG